MVSHPLSFANIAIVAPPYGALVAASDLVA
jgi:hypothetical protein